MNKHTGYQQAVKRTRQELDCRCSKAEVLNLEMQAVCTLLK